ncbi:MAG TPA: hypothetical protein VFO94_19980 [Gammaproteobacteria bacterium]|nr:hypothetical protein [Gammaproteobacteria bacterium]
MPVNVADFVARNFRGPTLPEIDRARTQNALGRLELTQQQNAVNRIPQANRLEDLRIQAAEQDVEQQRKANAASFLANRFSALAQSKNPKAAASAFVGGPDFRAAGSLLGLPVDQFTITAGDTDDAIRSSAADWARAIGMQTTATSDQPSKVQEYEYAKQNGFAGTYAEFLDRFYGREVSEPATVKAARYYESLTPEQRVRFNEANRNLPVENINSIPTRVLPGGGMQPLSTIDTEADAKRRLAAAQAAGTATGEATSPMKTVRIQAASRRLERVKQASEALKGGNPITGFALGYTGAGQELIQANSQLVAELTAITRIPGVGSQSDLEQRLQQLQLPTPEMYPAVRARAIAELEDFMRDLDSALGNVSRGTAPPPATSGRGLPDVTKMSDDELRRLANGG